MADIDCNNPEKKNLKLRILKDLHRDLLSRISYLVKLRMCNGWYARKKSSTFSKVLSLFSLYNIWSIYSNYALYFIFLSAVLTCSAPAISLSADELTAEPEMSIYFFVFSCQVILFSFLITEQVVNICVFISCFSHYSIALLDFRNYSAQRDSRILFSYSATSSIGTQRRNREKKTIVSLVVISKWICLASDVSV